MSPPAVFVAAVVAVVVVADVGANIVGTTVRAGDCVCATTGVNARDKGQWWL